MLKICAKKWRSDKNISHSLHQYLYDTGNRIFYLVGQVNLSIPDRVTVGFVLLIINILVYFQLYEIFKDKLCQYVTDTNIM